MSIGPEEQFFIDGMPIKSVNCFKYLGSIVTSDCSVNAELITRIQAVSCAYGRLRERVFNSHDFTLSTYVWFQLPSVQERHLRKILRIKWSDYLSNEEVLQRADAEDNEIAWPCVKDGELDKSTPPVGRPKLRY